MRSTSNLLVACVCLCVCLCVACSDKDGPPDPDAGRDATMTDTGVDAADSAVDGGGDASSDSGLDANPDAPLDARESDASEDASEDAGIDGTIGPDPCVTFTVGDPCTEGSEECGDDGRYTCDLDFRRCVPSGGRPICRGFAGATCPEDGTFTECLLNLGASGGPCLRVEEVACACPAHSDFYACPE